MPRRKNESAKKAEAFVRALRERSPEAHARLVGLLEGKTGGERDIFLFALYEQIVIHLLKDGAVPELCAEFGPSVVESMRIGTVGGESCTKCPKQEGCIPRLLHATIEEMQEEQESVTLH